MKEPYDELLGIRLGEDYSVLYAIEVPRAVLDRLYPKGKRTSWTKTLESDPQAHRIESDELMREGYGASRAMRALRQSRVVASDR